MFERSYLGSVTSMQLNGYYAAALFEGKIQLHQVHTCTWIRCMNTVGICFL